MVYSKDKSIFNNRFLIIMCSVALVLVVAIGVTFAWLSDITEQLGNSTIGEVGIEIYYNGTKVNGEIAEDGSYTIGVPVSVTFGADKSTVSFDLSVKNTGTIPGIVKCFISITDDDGPHDFNTNLEGAQWVLQTNQISITQTNWVNLYEDPDISDQYFFNSFLNEQLAANASKNIISSVTPIADGFEEQTIFIFVRAEIVAYSGNAYQVDTAENPVADKDKPFGVLTPEFLEQWTAWKTV